MKEPPSPPLIHKKRPPAGVSMGENFDNILGLRDPTEDEVASMWTKHKSAMVRKTKAADALPGFQSLL